MATLKDIEESQKSSKDMAAPLNSFSSIMEAPSTSMPMPTASVEAKQEYIIFRLVKKKRGRTHIDGICDNVLNPKTNRRERIWLLNGADSIWQSELLEVLKDKDYVKRNRRSLLFEDGVARIHVNDERSIEFAKANTNNVGKNRTNPGKYSYYEYNAAAEQEDRLKLQMSRINMITQAKEMPSEKMRKLASFLGVVFYDDLGQPKGDDGIRTELMLKADTQPLLFSKYIDSEEVDIAYMVKKAIIDTKIDLTGQNGNALWANGKGFICKIPAGRKPHEYLTELAMTNSEQGRTFKEQLQTFA